MAAPAPAVRFYNRLDRLGARAERAGRKAWREVSSDNIRASWDIASRDLAVSLSAGQVRAAEAGALYGAQTLAAQNLYTAPQAWVNPQAFGGFSPDGVPLRQALGSPVPNALRQIKKGSPLENAMRSSLVLAGLMARSMVVGAGQAAAGVDTYVRPQVGYVRMVNPGACDRCILLAGKFYRSNEGFLRHPNCYCVHVMTNAPSSADLLDDPYEVFKGLSEAEQNARFTEAGAQAIRDGADIYQVVNSRAGMSYAGVSANGTRRGQRALSTTTAGSSRRAHTGGIDGRLTPDAIYQQRLPREQTLGLLKQQGYLLDQGQVAGGVIRGPSTGVTGRSSTMTAAQQRVQTATLRWEAVQEGRNPFSGHDPLTPKIAADVEDQYRRWLMSRGEVFTR